MILKQELSKDAPLSSSFSLGIRLQTGFIFFVGLLLLITATIIITYIISSTIEQDAAGLLLSQSTLPPTEATLQIRQATNIGMVRGMYAALFLSTLIFLLVGLWFTEQTIVAPVEALHQIANRIASDDLDTPVTLGGYGEFLTLTHNFETMRLRLRQSREQLLRWAESLQIHVARRTQQLLALSQVVATASRSLDLDEVLRTALEQSLQVMDVEIGGLWLIDQPSGTLRLAAAAGMPEQMQMQLATIKVGEGFTGGAAQTGQTVVLDDISQLPAAGVRAVAIREGVRSLAVVPIKIRERNLGVLDVMTRRRRPFDPDEVALLTSIGQQIGIAVDNLRLLQETQRQAQQVAALQERERIGAELHDGFLQTLGYVYLSLDQLENRAAANGLTEMAGQLGHLDSVLERTSAEVRQYVADLRQTVRQPPVLLHSALAQMVAEFRREHDILITLETEGRPLVLAADQTAQLVRIAREALLNAVRHGQARHTFVVCAGQEKQGRLCIQDDGVGFVPGQLPEDGRKHFGLSIMQARADHLDGALSLKSQPGRGTRVQVVWPLEPQ
ncbi:MAG: GAF domain-containing protein [Anaerolineales bacterium]|nr:GAF domain-containing protein [Anaerolineales bacterium]